jgi:hypothetical protein
MRCVPPLGIEFEKTLIRWIPVVIAWEAESIRQCMTTFQVSDVRITFRDI